MKKIVSCLLILFSLSSFAGDDSCAHWNFIFKPLCQRVTQIWTEGSNDLYISGYAWHNRYIYSPEKIRKYNENAWGGGLGKGVFDKKGNWHGLYAITFLDSHSHLQPCVGYNYLKMFTVNRDVKIGLGYSVLVTSRVDINHNIPFPGAVPWVSVSLGKTSLGAAYIPGNSTNGNVLYVVAKYSFVD